jgi:hypothetical protein
LISYNSKALKIVTSRNTKVFYIALHAFIKTSSGFEAYTHILNRCNVDWKPPLGLDIASRLYEKLRPALRKSDVDPDMAGKSLTTMAPIIVRTLLERRLVTEAAEFAWACFAGALDPDGFRALVDEFPALKELLGNVIEAMKLTGDGVVSISENSSKGAPPVEPAPTPHPASADETIRMCMESSWPDLVAILRQLVEALDAGEPSESLSVQIAEAASALTRAAERWQPHVLAERLAAVGRRMVALNPPEQIAVQHGGLAGRLQDDSVTLAGMLIDRSLTGSIDRLEQLVEGYGQRLAAFDDAGKALGARDFRATNYLDFFLLFQSTQAAVGDAFATLNTWFDPLTSIVTPDTADGRDVANGEKELPTVSTGSADEPMRMEELPPADRQEDSGNSTPAGKVDEAHEPPPDSGGPENEGTVAAPAEQSGTGDGTAEEERPSGEVKKEERPAGSGASSRPDSDRMLEPPVLRVGPAVDSGIHKGTCTEAGASLGIGDADEIFLHDLLDAEHYRKAYWYLRSFPTEPGMMTLRDLAIDAIGSTGEGLRLMPGGTAGAQLFRFLQDLEVHVPDVLPAGNTNTGLLVLAGVLEAALFADPTPAPLYSLLPRLEATSGGIQRLSQFVSSEAVGRGLKIRAAAVAADAQEQQREDALRALRCRAREYLGRVDKVRIQYQPAESGLQYLYRTGGDLHRLHEIIATNDGSLRSELLAKIGQLNPISMVDGLVDDPAIPEVHCRLVGSPRDKLIRYLDTSVAMSREWAALIQRGGGAMPSPTLNTREFKKALNEALAEFVGNIGMGQATLGGRLALATLRRVQAKMTATWTASAAPDIDTCLLLPGIALDDDLEPQLDGDGDNEDFRNALRHLKGASVDLDAIFRECLPRDEFRRARRIITRVSDSQDLQDRLANAEADRIQNLRNEMDQLTGEIENAYLLGELSGTSASSTSPSIDRTDLIGNLQKVRRLLDETDGDGLRPIRAAAQTLRNVSGPLGELTKRRHENWRNELQALQSRFRDSDEGLEDWDYLFDTFSSCIKVGDDVAARELLERAQTLTPGARLPRMQRREILSVQEFLARSDQYGDLLTASGAQTNLLSAIQKPASFGPIDFGRLDRAAREQAARGVKAWNALRNLEPGASSPDLVGKLVEILSFLGFIVGEPREDVRVVPESDFVHARLRLRDTVAACPVPAFGSALGTEVDVVLCRVKKDPEQVGDYLKRRALRSRPVLLLHLMAAKNRFRTHMRRFCARNQMPTLVIDYTLLLHLCSVRDRLRTLFDLTLPFSWTQPYLMKGENVPDEVFVGREKERKSLCDPHGMCIVYGGRQLGKSSLLRHIARKEHRIQDGRFVAYIDINSLGNEPQTHDDMAAELCRQIIREFHQIGFLPHSSANRSMTKGERLFEDLSTAVRDRLDEPGIDKVLLLLDETDGFLDMDAQRDFPIIRRLRNLMAQTDRRFKVVFAGLNSVQRYARWRNQPFAQLGILNAIQPLDPLDGQKLILEPLQAMGFQFEAPSSVLRILSQTNYHPGLIQIFCHRLMEHLYDKVGNGGVHDSETGIRMITRDDVSRVEQDPAFMQDIRTRFDWTLDLDERYKVLIYSLVQTSRPTSGYSRNDFQDLARYWWPQVFQNMDPAAFDDLLDELVGLGVLIRMAEGRAVLYRLRSPNILRLLGSSSEIESDFERIIARPEVSKSNPRNYRAAVQDNQKIDLRVLTKEQEARLVNDLPMPFALVFVVGSRALGLDDVAENVRAVFKDMEAANVGPSGAWSEIRFRSEDLANGNRVVSIAEEAARPRKRKNLFAIIDGELLPNGPAAAGIFIQIRKRLSSLSTRETQTRIIVTLSPQAYWAALSAGHVERLADTAYIMEIQLRPWSDGAIRQAMGAVGHAGNMQSLMTNNRDAAARIRDITGGFHVLVKSGFDALARAKSRPATAMEAVACWENTGARRLDPAATSDTRRTDFGIAIDEPAVDQFLNEVLPLVATRIGEAVLGPEEFALLPDILSEPARKALADGGHLIQVWMQGTGLARTGRNPRELLIPQLILDIMQAGGQT